MRKKKDWEVILFIEETEGGETTNRPWYLKEDIKQLIEHSLHKAGNMRDLKVSRILVDPEKEPYYETEDIF